MKFIIRDFSKEDGSGTFRIRWTDNGRLVAKQWSYNSRNRDEQRANAEAFSRQKIGVLPSVINITENRSPDGKGRLRINWTEEGTCKRKEFYFTSNSYDSQKSRAEVFRNDLQRRLPFYSL